MLLNTVNNGIQIQSNMKEGDKKQSILKQAEIEKSGRSGLERNNSQDVRAGAKLNDEPALKVAANPYLNVTGLP